MAYQARYDLYGGPDVAVMGAIAATSTGARRQTGCGLLLEGEAVILQQAMALLAPKAAGV